MTSGSTLEPVTPLTRRAPKVGRALVAAALALGGIAAAQAQARYALTELPLLPGAASCAPTRLNDRGDVVGYCAPAADVGQVVGSSHPPFGSRPVVWNNDAAHTPHALPTLDGDNNGRAFAINTLGHVLGAS